MRRSLNLPERGWGQDLDPARNLRHTGRQPRRPGSARCPPPARSHRARTLPRRKSSIRGARRMTTTASSTRPSTAARPCFSRPSRSCGTATRNSPTAARRTPTVKALEQAIAEVEGGAATALTASGYQAVSMLVAARPTALYVILGATHPDLIRRGRGVSAMLEDRRIARGDRHVRFVDRFVGRVELGPLAPGRRRLRDALSEPRPDRVRDAVVRDGRRQCDRVHALRLRDGAARDGRGILVPPGSTAALAGRADGLLATTASGLRSGAAPRAQPPMVWPSVGAAYRELFAVSPSAAHRRRPAQRSRDSGCVAAARG